MRSTKQHTTMAELGLEDQIYQQRSGYGTRDVSPDSVIFTSLFSSASGSVDRCSFASDIHDQNSLLSEEHLAGHDLRETSSGPDSDPKKPTVHTNSRSRKVQKEKVHKEDNDADIRGKNEILASARSSFSQALKELTERRSRTEVLLENLDRQRHASLELHNHVTDATNSSSPLFGAVKKSSVLTCQAGMCPSPGMPNYRHNSVGIQKGWSSERVPLHNSANRRHLGASLMPFNNGRTLPSKWEDAERWIFSPVTGDSVMKPSFPMPYRRPKSKSGPLRPPGIPNYLLHSPAVPTFQGASVGNLMSGSPFSAGVIAPDGFPVRLSVGSSEAGLFPDRMEPCMVRSMSLHGYFELQSQPSLPALQDEKLDGDKDEAPNIFRAVSRRDAGTQMTPEGSPHSSPSRRLSCSPSTPSNLAIVELESVHSSKLEVRDVQVDDRFTITRWSKKHKARFPGKSSENVGDWKRKALEFRSSAWEVSETAKGISKVKGEEAKITAWENLQKAKAEAAMKKLEMKLEKRRSSSIDKIMNKLRSAQKKAQEMRSSVSSNKPKQVSRTSQKAISLHRTYQISSLSGCFTCHAF